MKRIEMGMALLLAVLLLLLTACGGSVEARWQEQYDLGVKYLSEGNYEEAVIAFTAAIDIDSKRYEAYVGRGDSYFAMGTEESMETALLDYQTALELAEEAQQMELRLKVAGISVCRGDLEQAEEIFMECRQADEKTMSAYLRGLLLQLVEQEKIAEVKAIYELSACRDLIESFLGEDLAEYFPYSIVEEAYVGELPFLSMNIHELGPYQAALGRLEQNNSDLTGEAYWDCSGYLGTEHAYLNQDVDAPFVNSIHIQYFPDNDPGMPFWLSAWGLEGGDSYREVLEKMNFPNQWENLFLAADGIRLYVASSHASVSLEFDQYKRNEKAIHILWSMGEEMVSWDFEISPFSGYDDDVDSFLHDIRLSHNIYES